MAIISIPSSFAGVSIPSNVFNPNSPLDLLYGGLGVKTYKYPSDLATSPSKSHYVQFSIKEIIPASYGGGTGGAGGGTEIGPEPLGDFGGAGFGESTIPGDRIDLGNISSFGTELAAVGNLDFGVFGDAVGGILSEGLQISPTTTQPKAVVSLYMPDTLNAQYNSSYDELRLTDLGSAINTIRTIDQLAARGPSLIDAFKSGYASGGLFGSIKSGIKQAGNIASTDPAAISLITNAMGRIPGINGGNVQSLLLKGAGYAINPQLQMIYRGVGLRSFQLTFVFTPNSQGEADEINYIIQQFKYHFAPTLLSAKETSSDAMYFKPPSIFSVNFMISGKQNKFLPKYGDCVLTDIDVNYAPNGWAAYDDGAPIQTTLTMSFKETEILDKNKIQKGYKGLDGGLR
jgi:hypothetical protein